MIDLVLDRRYDPDTDDTIADLTRDEQIALMNDDERRAWRDADPDDFDSWSSVLRSLSCRLDSERVQEILDRRDNPRSPWVGGYGGWTYEPVPVVNACDDSDPIPF